MNTFNTDRKFTVIVSATTKDNNTLDNLVATCRMNDNLEHRIHCHAIRVIGVWNGEAEQSFIIHTNSSSTVTEIKRLALDVYGQSSVLVSNNRKHDVTLHNSDVTTDHIGTHFSTISGKQHRMPACYIITNGDTYWAVM